jgi:hypothetical protein
MRLAGGRLAAGGWRLAAINAAGGWRLAAINAVGGWRLAAIVLFAHHPMAVRDATASVAQRPFATPQPRRCATIPRARSSR